MNAVQQIGTEPDPAKRLRTRWGASIAQVRGLRSMTRDELAEAVGVSASAVGMWERGETSPRDHHRAAVARALDVPVAVLFSVET